MRDHKGRHPLDRACDPETGQICIGTDKGKPQMTSRTTRSRAYAAAALTAALTLGLTACGGSDNTADPTPTPPQSPSPTKSLSPTEQATNDAQAELKRYYEVVDQVGQRKAPIMKLKTVAISTALTYQTQISKSTLKNGQKQVGDVAFTVNKVMQVSLDNSAPKKGKVPYVQMQVCADVTNVDVVDKNGKSVVLPTRRNRSLVVLTVANYNYAKNPHNDWKVASQDTSENTSC